MTAGGLRAGAGSRAGVRTGGRWRTLLRRARATGTALATAALVVLALGSVAGRWRVVPVTSTGELVDVAEGSIVLLTPTPAQSLQPGDTVFLGTEADPNALRRVVGIYDSWNREFRVDRVSGSESAPGARAGDDEVVVLPAMVGRVTRSVPYLGRVFEVLVGPVQAIVLVVAGSALVAWSYGSGPELPPDSRARRWRRGRRTRVAGAGAAAAAVAVVGAGAVAVALVTV